MFEFKRPEPKAALVWMAVWLVALIALAMVPLDEARPDFAAMPDEIHYSHGTSPEYQGYDAPYIKARS
jgi:hypothetical protein